MTRDEERIIALHAECLRLQTELDDTLVDLADVICQACGENGTDELDSMALSAYRDGLARLAKHGVVEIIHQHGRRIIAHLTPKTKTT